MTRMTLGSIILAVAGIVACRDAAGPSNESDPTTPVALRFQAFGEWSAPVELPATVNAPGSDTRNAFEAANGQFLYYASVRDDGFGGRDLYASRWLPASRSWGPGINLGPNVNVDVDNFHGDNHPNVPEAGHWLFFSSWRSSPCAGGDESRDIYLAYRRNVEDPTGWEPAVNMGCTVNSADDETAPAFFDDEATHTAQLFFSSTRPGSEGEDDFWVSTRRPDGSWGSPVQIAELSSEFSENKIAIRSDGLEAFFSSTRPTTPGGEEGDFNIWTSTRTSTSAPWSPPTLVLEGFGLPTLSADGNRLYVTSGTSADPDLAGIYVATRPHVPSGQNAALASIGDGE